MVKTTNYKALKERVINLELKIKEIIDRLEFLGQEIVKRPAESNVSVTIPEIKVETPSVSDFPVPTEYRGIVNQLLNQDFGIKIEPADGSSFLFTVIVPDKYSPTTLAQRKMLGGNDIRPKVITHVEGENGVRLWTERVFNNFNSEIKAAIIADRKI